LAHMMRCRAFLETRLNPGRRDIGDTFCFIELERR